MKSGYAPLAVQVPDDVGGGAGAAIEGAGVGVGGGAGATTRGDTSVGVEEEFNWLNKDLEGEDFVDDIFGESSPPHTVPSDLNTVPTTDTSQQTTNTPYLNSNTPQPNTDTLGPSNVPPPNIDLDEKVG